MVCALIEVVHHTDPGCPWAWSASPAHAVLRWRYGDQLRWRLVMIGLTERADQYLARGYTPDGPVRYTAPSLLFEAGDRRLEAGGFQPVEAYDVLIANLDPTLARTPPPESALAVLRALPYPLVTQEVAAVLAHGNAAPDRDAAEAELIDLAAAGDAVREGVGDDALWAAT